MTNKQLFDLINQMIKEYQCNMTEAAKEEDNENASFYMGAAWSLTLLKMKVKRKEKA